MCWVLFEIVYINKISFYSGIIWGKRYEVFLVNIGIYFCVENFGYDLFKFLLYLFIIFCDI